MRSAKAIGPHRRALAALVVALAALTLVGIVLLLPEGSRPAPPVVASFSVVVDASVERVTTGPCGGIDDPQGPSCRRIDVRVQEGPEAGRLVTIELPEDDARSRGLEVGDGVVLGRQADADPAFRYALVDLQRRQPLLLLAGLFAVAVVALGRLRGIAALAALGATIATLLLFVIPSILDGRDPLLVSLVGASAIAFLSLYLSHGFGARTTVALLGTLGGLACTATLAGLFMGLAHITGFETEEAFIVSVLGGEVDIRGLTLGGMIIGALGAIDDMTVTQASAVWELRATNPRAARPRLTRAAMRIGRDHVAATVNTLVLAYAGASMPVLMLLVLTRQSLGTVANGEIVATEIVRSLVGSIGLVLSVPITTWLAIHASSPRPAGSAPDRPASTGGTATPDGPETGPQEVRIPDRRRDIWFRRR